MNCPFCSHDESFDEGLFCCVAMREAAAYWGDHPEDLAVEIRTWLLRELPAGRLRLKPTTLREANAFVRRHHRHSGPVTGWKFGVALEDELGTLGVAIAGRPTARLIQNAEARTIEISRACILPIETNACSRLYGALCRAAKALGYTKAITYTLASESGASLKAAGFQPAAQSKGGTWDRPSRHRITKTPTEPKIRWEKSL